VLFLRNPYGKNGQPNRCGRLRAPLPGPLRLRPARLREKAKTAAVLLALGCLGAAPAKADQNYSQQVFFDNSLSPGSYFYSSGHVSPPSRLTLVDGKLPIETKEFISGPNALELQWQSAPEGGWTVELNLYDWRNRTRGFPGDHLWLWLRSDKALRSHDLPHLALRDDNRDFTWPLSIGDYAHDLAAGEWTRVRIPLAAFRTASMYPFEPHRLSTLVFVQGEADNAVHTLLIDDIRIENDPPANESAPPTPADVKAKGYERHIDITWKPVDDPGLAQYVIYRSTNGGKFEPIGVQRPGVNRYCDYTGDPHRTAAYQVTARTSSLRESPPSAPATASTHPMTDDELMTMVEEASFRYYWEGAEPHSGMIRESNPGDDNMVALGASGFGVMAIVVGADRGFVTKQQAIERLLQITSFLDHADRYRGGWPHFLDGATGRRMQVFGIFDDGADLVETSFLMEGLLTARQYFKDDGAAGHELYDRITRLWEGVDWDWFRATPRRDALWWHWSPDYSFYIANRLTGWNETMITYLEAIASPTHGIPASTYYTGWAAEGTDHTFGEKHTYFGIQLDMNYLPGSPGPLFFTQYSYMGFDPRGLRDRYTDYFENNRDEALMSQAYAIANPLHRKGYGADCWGLTAVDGPDGYDEYKPFLTDDGTIAPTGAIASFAYTPDQSMLALKHFYRDLGAEVWSIYGFRDSFNLEQNWYSGITMGLNQAPMAVMIENARSGLIWKNFMANPEIPGMIERIGFRPDPPSSASISR
jgi:exo beta-1,2-glucooligosaccharide sophorohydrolase (non-reducing end)